MKQIKLDTFDVDTLWKLKLKLLVRILMSCSMFNLVLRCVRGAGADQAGIYIPQSR